MYFTKENKEKADKLANHIGVPLSRLMTFLIEYYIRKEKIKFDAEVETADNSN